MTIRRMCITCWIPKAKNTHSEYVIGIAFRLQQWSREGISMSCLRAHCTLYSYIVCLVDSVVTILFGQTVNCRDVNKWDILLNYTLCPAKQNKYTVIHRLTKIMRSGTTFVSRNVIIRRLTSHCLERKQPSRICGSLLCDVVSSFLCHTHTDRKYKLLEWPCRSCLLLYVSARIH